MKPHDLHSVWSMPDNSRLTAKQFSFRLPVHVAAKLGALCEVYPGKTRTQIVADLLATAIEQAVEGLPTARGRHIDRIETDAGDSLDVFEDVGLKGRFKTRANVHFAALERELGNETPGLAYEYNYFSANPDGRDEAFTVAEEAKR